jgi:hypothetical protein
MKGARLLSQVYSVSHDNTLRDEASRTVQYVLGHQESNGGWNYAVGDARQWKDNFHTGYVLDCLEQYMKSTGDQSVSQSLNLGFDFYRSRFFESDGTPKYYDRSTYPVDSTAAAQSVLTLCRFGDLSMAALVVRWMIAHMQSSKGYFYYQKHSMYVNRISYMRWSNAWMFLALSFLLSKHHSVS